MKFFYICKSKACTEFFLLFYQSILASIRSWFMTVEMLVIWNTWALVELIDISKLWCWFWIDNWYATKMFEAKFEKLAKWSIKGGQRVISNESFESNCPEMWKLSETWYCQIIYFHIPNHLINTHIFRPPSDYLQVDDRTIISFLRNWSCAQVLIH